MDKTLEELDLENWELLSAAKYFREAYVRLREENKILKKQLQELMRLSNYGK